MWLLPHYEELTIFKADPFAVQGRKASANWWKWQ